MKRESGRAQRRWLVPAIGVVAAAWLGGGTAAEEPPLRAGLGVAALPTPIGAPLAGYGGLRDRSATGVLDIPEVRALVLESGDLRVALVAFDLVIVRAALRDALIEAVAAAEIDVLIATATHTHSGPGGYVDGWLAERVTAGSFDPDAAGALIAAGAAAVVDAVGDLRAVRSAVGAGSAALAMNRSRPDGPTEHDLPVAVFVPEDDAPPIVLFAYGVHPVVLGPESLAYSADYAGAARRALHASGLRAIFVAGPLGDQNPAALPQIPDSAKASERVDLFGHLLADRVELALRTLRTPAAGLPLTAVERWIDLPEPHPRRWCALWWLDPLVGHALDGFIARRVPLHALRLGDAVFLTLPAEPATTLGDALRAVGGGAPTFVLAHANDWVGYAVTAENYARGAYEACLSFHGPGIGERWVREAGETLRALDERAAATR